mgnify:CR=1 FL=1
MKHNDSKTEVRFLRPKDLAKRLSVSIATIWRMVKRGDLPPPKKITPSISAWPVSDIEDWEGAL